MAPLQSSGHHLNWLNGCLQNLNLRMSWQACPLFLENHGKIHLLK